MRAIRLDPSGVLEECEVEVLRDYQEAVEGYIWPLNTLRDASFRKDVVIYYNERAHLVPEALDENATATALFASVLSEDREPKELRGPILAVGLDFDTGYEEPLPDTITVDNFTERTTWIEKT